MLAPRRQSEARRTFRPPRLATSPRGRNQLHTASHRHLKEFCDVYDEKHAAKYGRFRLERIRDIGERFLPAERPRRSADYIPSVHL